jgi:ferric-dicitrate binding protein FerR (iron transport regulator)
MTTDFEPTDRELWAQATAGSTHAGCSTGTRGLLAAVTPRRSRRWLAPLVAAATALAVVGLVAWFVPWGPGGGAFTAPEDLHGPEAPP